MEYIKSISNTFYKYRKYYFAYVGIGCILMVIAVTSDPNRINMTNQIKSNHLNSYEKKNQLNISSSNYSTISFSDNEIKNCEKNEDCGHGKCSDDGCTCDHGWINLDNEICSYHQKNTLVAFLVSFFVGEFGVDWFYLSCGKAGYIVAGIFKLLTFGGLGIWYLVDWIRILAGAFPDANGIELSGWN